MQVTASLLASGYRLQLAGCSRLQNVAAVMQLRWPSQRWFAGFVFYPHLNFKNTFYVKNEQ